MVIHLAVTLPHKLPEQDAACNEDVQVSQIDHLPTAGSGCRQRLAELSRWRGSRAEAEDTSISQLQHFVEIKDYRPAAK